MKHKLELIIVFLTVYSSILSAQSYGSWFVTDTLHEKRKSHAGVQLDDGNILVTGGGVPFQYYASNETEIYDVNNHKWKVAVPMNKGRAEHSLIKLKDGSIIAIGGFSEMTCEILSNDYSTWAFTDSLNTRRWWGQNAVLMQDGNVLLTGGTIDIRDSSFALRECEIYNYSEKNWEQTTPLNTGRFYHTATVLKDGRVLIIGGLDNMYGRINSCEIYDPSIKKWTFAAPMNYSRAEHSATLLSNGKVLVIGGYPKISELYDPLKNQWEIVGSVNLASYANQAVTLNNEEFLLLISWDNNYNYNWELYSLKNFESVYSKRFDRKINNPVITKIDDQRVLFAGGKEIIFSGTEVLITSTNFCQIYDITLTGIEEEKGHNVLPSQLSLNCYPNPFNSSTNIIVKLNLSNRISLNVYNTLGEKISTIYEGELNAGLHTFRFDMNKYSSGVYFVRISSQKEAQLIKIIHQK